MKMTLNVIEVSKWLAIFDIFLILLNILFNEDKFLWVNNIKFNNKIN